MQGKQSSNLALAYDIIVRPYRVSEHLEVVSIHNKDTILKSTVQHRSGANANETATPSGVPVSARRSVLLRQIKPGQPKRPTRCQAG